jgi:hypothetical protein
MEGGVAHFKLLEEINYGYDDCSAKVESSRQSEFGSKQLEIAPCYTQVHCRAVIGADWIIVPMGPRSINCKSPTGLALSVTFPKRPSMGYPLNTMQNKKWR